MFTIPNSIFKICMKPCDVLFIPKSMFNNGMKANKFSTIQKLMIHRKSAEARWASGRVDARACL